MNEAPQTERTATEANNNKPSFATLRNIHRRNREEVQELFFARKKLQGNRDIIADVSKTQTRKEMEGDIDSLTGLYNKNGFQKRLNEILQSAKWKKAEFVAIVLDADGLKRINDEQGHQEGDKYIAKIGRIFTENTRQSGDFIGRTGGDEFVVILVNPGKNGVKLWWNRMNESFTENGVRISAGSSPVNPDNPQAAIKEADEAMYAAKLNKANLKNNFMLGVKSEGVFSFSEYKARKTAKKSGIESRSMI